MRIAIVVSLLTVGLPVWASDEPPGNFRRPKNEAELRYWLQNMVWHHRFTEAEISAATGLKTEEIRAAVAKFAIRPETGPRRAADAPLLVLPYPGGRVWANPKVPCIHSDPRFPDCRPGQTRRLRGWLSFYEGDDIEAELRRIDGTGWRRGRAAGERTPRGRGG